MVTERKRGSVMRRCAQCGNEFSVFLSTLAVGKGRCCSKACATAFRVGKKMTGPRKTRKDKKPRMPHVCGWCGKVFYDGTHLRKTRQYCSNKCLGFSKRKNNKEHPRRKQVAELQRWAREVILRDKSCVRCGARENLQAHHVKSYAKHPEQRLDVNNGVALCPLCHHAQHPTHQLDWYLKRGGQTVQRCVFCERAFVPRRQTQRTCSPSCGARARQSRRTYRKQIPNGEHNG